MADPTGLTFAEVLTECTHNREFREQYNRLTKSHVGAWAPGIQQDAKEREFARFAAFVFDAVWCRLPAFTAAREDSNGPK